MSEGRPQPIVAIIFDFYFLNLLLCSLWGCLVIIRQESLSLKWMMLTIVFSLLAAIVYHGFIASRVGLLSFGERFTGKILHDGVKLWHNPFFRNRFLLFFGSSA